MTPIVLKVCVRRVRPSGSSSKRAVVSPRSSQLPNFVHSQRGGSASRISVGLRIRPKWLT